MKPLLTCEQLEQQIAASRARVEDLANEDAQLAQKFNGASLEPESEAAIAKLYRQRRELAERREAEQDRLLVLQAALNTALEEAVAAERAAQRERIDALLKARVEAMGVLDKWLKSGAQHIETLMELNVKVLEMSGATRQHLPALFGFPSIQKICELKLYGATNGAWTSKGLLLETPSTARELAGLQSRGVEERERVLTALDAAAGPLRAIA